MSTDPQQAQHLSDEQTLRLALVAPASGEESTHLQGCDHCRAEVEATRRVVGALSAPAEILEPPAGLWERIRHQIEDETGAETEDEKRHPAGDETGHGTAGGAATAATRRAPLPWARRGGPAPSAPVRRRSQQGGQRRGRLAAAAAAGVLVGAVAGAVGFGLAASGRDDDGGDPGIVQIGATTLDPVAAESMSGQARLERDEQGRLLLAVDVSELPEDGYLEVWLRDADATRLVSLGVLDTTTGTLQVPQGIDLTDYPVVDVSQEHLDGDPTHGGQTLVAGALPRT